MADKKPSGFKTFLLLVVTLFLAFFLGCGAFLMFVPDAQLFGLCYVSNNAEQYVKKVGSDRDLHFSDYEKVFIDTSNLKSGNANVEINYGAGIMESHILLKEKSSGFTAYEDTRKDYNLQTNIIGRNLYLTLTEPQYTFIQVTKSTVLKINILPTENISSVAFDITTNNGSVTFGGLTRTTGTASELRTTYLTVKSENGNIITHNSARVTAGMSLTTTNGAINITNDISATNVALSAERGKITAPKLTGNVTLTSFNSHILINEVGGNVILDTESGIVEIKKIGGSLSCTDSLKYTSIRVGDVAGDVSLAPTENQSFSVKLNKVSGSTSILAGEKSIEVAETGAYTYIETTSGSITTKKSSANTSSFTLKTTSGGIFVTFDLVQNDNLLTSTSGAVKVKYKSSNSFYLYSSGETYFKNLDTTESNVSKPIYGEGNAITSNNITINTTNKTTIESYE